MTEFRVYTLEFTLARSLSIFHGDAMPVILDINAIVFAEQSEQTLTYTLVYFFYMCCNITTQTFPNII